MAYITVTQADTIITREGGPDSWASISAITGPPSVTVDQQKERFIERATRRIESVPFDDKEDYLRTGERSFTGGTPYPTCLLYTSPSPRD